MDDDAVAGPPKLDFKLRTVQKPVQVQEATATLTASEIKDAIRVFFRQMYDLPRNADIDVSLSINGTHAATVVVTKAGK